MWGREGVTFTNGAVDQRKKPDEKKIGIDQGAGCLEADRRTEKEKKENAISARHQRDREKRKRKRKRQRKKSGKERNLQR